MKYRSIANETTTETEAQSGDPGIKRKREEENEEQKRLKKKVQESVPPQQTSSGPSRASDNVMDIITTGRRWSTCIAKQINLIVEVCQQSFDVAEEGENEYQLLPTIQDFIFSHSVGNTVTIERPNNLNSFIEGLRNRGQQN